MLTRKNCNALVFFIIKICTFAYSHKYTNADYMDSLDYLICTQIKEPTASFCDSLCENLDRYNDNQVTLLESLRNKEVESAEAIAGYFALGKPKCTEDFDSITIQNLQNSLLKTNQDIKQVYERIEKIKMMWEEFKKECETGNNKFLCYSTPGYFT